MTSTRLNLALLTMMALVGAYGCHDSVMIGAGDAATDGGGSDATTPPPDGGTPDGSTPDGSTVDSGGGEACGAVTCAVGMECCNASCGTCVAPGEGCLAIECVTTCDDETCDSSSAVCCPGCSGDLFCSSADGVCPEIACPIPPPSCGGEAGVACGPSEYCDYVSGCGFDDSLGTCRPKPEGCLADCPGVCGCDGVTYCNECGAASAGVDVIRAGACDAPATCAPDRARGVGACDAIVGVAWNGSDCVVLSGCSCEGADCGRYTDRSACLSAHSSCGTTSTGCGGFTGATCGASEWCDYPEGAFCGAADAGGACRPRPDACPDIWAPVCGCNGVTYSNECDAQSAGQDVASPGECTTGTDCRTTGCTPDSTCSACAPGEWVCLAPDVVCAF